MVRFLSPEWFTASGAGPASGRSAVVVEQVVEGAPEGRVVYRVEAGPQQAGLVWPVPPDAPEPDLRFTCDWATSVAIAKGELSTQRALMAGRLRVSGDLRRVTSVTAIDPVPPEVRRNTTWGGDPGPPAVAVSG